MEEPWYHDEISRADAVKLLSEDGDYLVRFSDNQRCYVLTAMCKGEVKNFIINKVSSDLGIIRNCMQYLRKFSYT